MTEILSEQELKQIEERLRWSIMIPADLNVSGKTRDLLIAGRSDSQKLFHMVRALQSQKDSAYAERNRLVAGLAALYPSWLEEHPKEDKDWEDDWRTIVFINTPYGQLSWHIHDSQKSWFEQLPWRYGEPSWDGHTTEEKYERLANLVKGIGK
jgi:hypothetical protein